MTTIYCELADVQSLMSPATVAAFVDDNEDGTNDAAELVLIDDAIEQAAAEMNGILEQRYTLSDLTSNDWAKWCNATLAAQCLTARRGNPEMFAERADRYRDQLEEIDAGRRRVPEASVDFDYRPTVTNFDVERWRAKTPVRVDVDASTGAVPEGDIKRKTARDRHFGIRDR